MKLRSAWIPWVVVGFLFFLCGLLAFLQNRRLGEESRADRQRLHQDLQDELELIRHDFDGQVRRAVAAVTPTADQIREMGAQNAVALRFASHKPAEFQSFKIVEAFNAAGPAVVETRLPGTEQRVALELDRAYLRRVTFPALFARYLDSGLKVQYQAEVVSGGMRANDVIFETNPGMDLTSRPVEGSIGLLDLRQGFPPGPPPGSPTGPPPGLPMALLQADCVYWSITSKVR